MRFGRIWLAACWAIAGCSRPTRPQDLHAELPAGDPRGAGDAAEGAWSIDPSHSAPPPRKGMIWIPAGTLIAGTPAERTPRIADEELAGVPIALSGFYIDEFPYPNEGGAIPKTGFHRDDATQLCAVQEKRLCTELEWERACKGPAQFVYEYGDLYRASECATGSSGRIPPSGMRIGCKSAFGVKDMHGGAWEWTSNRWGRDNPDALVTLRGGNAQAGELVGRCANAIGRPPSLKRPEFGARCCASHGGEENTAAVELSVQRAKVLDARAAVHRDLEMVLLRALEADSSCDLPKDATRKVDRVWAWHPVGNEELTLFAACSRLATHLLCGIEIARTRGDSTESTETVTTGVAFASSGWWAPVLREDHKTHDVWVYGGDHESNFRRRISYAWGRIAVGDLERRVPDGG